MATRDAELLAAARHLIRRRSGQRGRLAGARVRRSISTTYYALFQFLLDEVGARLVGSSNELRKRRQVLARSLTHSGVKLALDKVRVPVADKSVADLLRPGNSGEGLVTVPAFVSSYARAFSDAQAKRHDADYDMNKPLSERDARLLLARASTAINDWRSARTPADRDFKHAMCLLLLLRGQIRRFD